MKNRTSYPHNESILILTNASAGLYQRDNARIVVFEMRDELVQVSRNIAAMVADRLAARVEESTATYSGKVIHVSATASERYILPDIRTVSQAIHDAIGITASPGRGDAITDYVGAALAVDASRIEIDADRLLTMLGVSVEYSDSVIQCDRCYKYVITQPATMWSNPNDGYIVHPDGFAVCAQCAANDHAAAKEYHEAYAHQWYVASAYRDASRVIPGWPDTYAGILPDGYTIAGYIPFDYTGRPTIPDMVDLMIGAGYTPSGYRDSAPPIIRKARFSRTAAYRYWIVYAPRQARIRRVIASAVPGFTATRPNEDK